ncbi:MAG TPA: hypothetical protein VFI00_02170 [Kribbella sp.]|nr:hypothetical protein [Kribbella sp.]
MEYLNYSQPMPGPYSLEFEGHSPHHIARLMIAHPGTDLRTAVRDYDGLLDDLYDGRVHSAAGELGATGTPESLHLAILQRESRHFGQDAQTGQFVSRDGRSGDEVAAAINQQAQAIWAQLPRDPEGGEHLAQALLAEVSVEARYRHVRTLEANQSGAADALQPAPESAVESGAVADTQRAMAAADSGRAPAGAAAGGGAAAGAAASGERAAGPPSPAALLAVQAAAKTAQRIQAERSGHGTSR